jgi:hypothetical protein
MNSKDIIKETKASFKQKLSIARKGSTQTYSTKKKISNALKNEPSNFKNKTHSKETKDLISTKRGHLSRVDDLKWIVNRFNKQTFRKRELPNQQYKYGRVIKRFRDFEE